MVSPGSCKPQTLRQWRASPHGCQVGRERFSILIEMLRFVIEDAFPNKFKKIHIAMELSGEWEIKDQAITVRIEVEDLCVAGEMVFTCFTLV